MELNDQSPDRKTLEVHLGAVRFLVGQEQGRWEMLQIDFPHLYVRIKGTDPETGSSTTQDFHLLCDGYPLPGPFVERWDFAQGCRPSPPKAGCCSPGFCDALKDWDHENRHGGIYRAWQRYAAVHNDWANKRPDEAWHQNRQIAFILEKLHELVVEQAVWLGIRQQQAA
ncbi:MAG: hypothetical protein HZC23_15025 [Rhodocyclales bacterium]|nr:hypothetical protein [Rhodocyclales bacterium]